MRQVWSFSQIRSSEMDATLAFTGDLAPQRPLDDEYTRKCEVWEYLRSADLAMVNFEVPLTKADVPVDKAITLRADPDVASSIRGVGVDVATVANNHALDYGSEGLLETIEVLENSGIVVVGAGESLGKAMQPAILSVGDLEVAVFGLASTLPPGYAAGPWRPGIAPVRINSRFRIDGATLDEQPGMSPWVETEAVEEDILRACSRIAEVRPDVDLVVIQMHWGIPNGWCAAFQGPLADYQRPLGHALIEAGADVIVGHHPHAVHGVERYGSGLIAYSLGNFLFHSMGLEERSLVAENDPPYDLTSLQTGEAIETVLMEIRIEERRMTQVRFLSARMNDEGEPEFLGGASARAVFDRLALQSSRLGTSVEIGTEEASLDW